MPACFTPELRSLVVAFGVVGFETWIPAILIVAIMSIIVYFWSMFDAFSSESLTHAWCSVIGIFIPVVANLVYGIFLADSRTLRWAYASWT